MKIARGDEKAELVLKNCRIIDVFNGKIIEADIAIDGGYIVGIGDYSGVKEKDLKGKYVSPGFIDAHVHIESSMLTPSAYAKLVMPKGTTSVIADPHEIANVAGSSGIEFMIESSKTVPLDVYFMIPSCVPATSFENSGAVLGVEEISKLKSNDSIIGLGEMMNYPGVIYADNDVHDKLTLMEETIIDGHSPSVSGKELNAYVCAGVSTDHECTTKEEMQEKLSKGMYVHIREGSATRNLKTLVKGITPMNSFKVLFCTDDKEPLDLYKEGHIDHNIRKAIKLGLDPMLAYKIATINAAMCYRLKRKGGIAPGYEADLVIIDDLEKVSIDSVYKKGKLVAVGDNAKFEVTDIKDESVLNTVNVSNVDSLNFDIVLNSGVARVIGLIDKEIVTNSFVRKVETVDNKYVFNDKLDILKLAVVERHKKTGNVGLGLVEGYGLKSGAVGLTIAHDSHNIIVIGTNDEDMKTVIKKLDEINGGICIAKDGEVLASFTLEVGGLMTSRSYEEAYDDIMSLYEVISKTEVNKNIEPFMTLAFLALPVIPELKLTDEGLFDVTKFEFTDIEV